MAHTQIPTIIGTPELPESVMSDDYTELLEYVKVNRRACPQPIPWNAVWEMLPGRRRAGNGWEPALPLILAAWWDTPKFIKQLRFLDHLEWAHKHGCIGTVGAYLRNLPESDWYHFGD